MPQMLRSGTYTYLTNGKKFSSKWLCCYDNGPIDVAAIYHIRTKSIPEYIQNKCEKNPINSDQLQQGCVFKHFEGEFYDDQAWEFLRTSYPSKYFGNGYIKQQ